MKCGSMDGIDSFFFWHAVTDRSTKVAIRYTMSKKYTLYMRALSMKAKAHGCRYYRAITGMVELGYN